MTNVVVAKQRTIHVSTNATGGIINTVVPVTLKNTPTIFSGNGVSTFAHLQDVVTINETDGSTVIYDAISNKYIVKPLDLANTIGTLDGGVF